MKKLLRYLNPIARLGINRYSVLFPLIFSLVVCVLSEIFSLGILKNPEAVGSYIIIINIASIIYFSFRDGTRGGFTATSTAILYYFYIIFTRQYTDQKLITGIETTLVLAGIYSMLAAIIGWLKQAIDKSIEREADQRRRLEAIIEQLPVGVIITDSQARVVKTNKQLENILGLAIPAGFNMGKDSTKLNGKYKNKKYLPSHSPVAQALASGRVVAGKELSFERKGGKEVFVQINASPIFNRQGKIIAATSIITDITSQKEIESRKDEFINMASHELKTPITSMKLYVESMLERVEKFGDERVMQTLKSIKYQTEKLQELASDLLDVTRIQTGKLSFNMEEFKLQDLIEESAAELQATTKLHKIKFLKKNPVKVYADRFRISQVLTNLLTNAIKYSPEGGDINIEMERKGGEVMVMVEDFGIGVAKGEHKKIFNRLYQVIDPHVKTFPGLGMGLYISKEIIIRHKGKIGLKDKNGPGSIFFFELPI